jgi:AAA domain
MSEKNQPYKYRILRFPRVEEGRAQIWDSRAFLKATFPLREPLVVIDGKETPVFTKHSINQIFATRGTGKSMLMMALAGMHSTGGNFLNWRITRPASVLYVDGERPNPQIQERMAQLHSSDARIHLITLDDHPNGIPTLDTPPGQEWLEKELGGVEVLVLDSIASLAPFSTNDEQKWIPFIMWLQRLRSRGLCIYLLHQAGKRGLQRGHSRGDDPLDVQIKLGTKDATLEHLNFELTYEKIRGLRNGVRAVAVEFQNGQWKWHTLETDKMRILQEYRDEHPNQKDRSVRKIAKALPQLGSHVTVYNLMRKLDKQKNHE